MKINATWFSKGSADDEMSLYRIERTIEETNTVTKKGRLLNKCTYQLKKNDWKPMS